MDADKYRGTGTNEMTMEPFNLEAIRKFTAKSNLTIDRLKKLISHEIPIVML